MTAKAAIVVEGGAMRGVFSVGVLDVFLEEGFVPFDLAIGVSAGACNLSSHLAGQDGRNRRAYFDLMTRREFIDLRRILVGGSVVDLDWLWAALAAREPLDVDAIARNPTEFIVAATSVATGEPLYVQPTPSEMFDALKGSCALPVLYRSEVRVGSEILVDGGVSDPIPVQKAYELGARRLVVVRSRPADFMKTHGWGARMNAFLLRSRPAVARSVGRTARRYQEAVGFMNSPPEGCQIVHVAPPTPLATKRTTQDREALEHDYGVGREMGAQAIRTWAALE